MQNVSPDNQKNACRFVKDAEEEGRDDEESDMDDDTVRGGDGGVGAAKLGGMAYRLGDKEGPGRLFHARITNAITEAITKKDLDPRDVVIKTEVKTLVRGKQVILRADPYYRKEVWFDYVFARSEVDRGEFLCKLWGFLEVGTSSYCVAQWYQRVAAQKHPLLTRYVPWDKDDTPKSVVMEVIPITHIVRTTVVLKDYIREGGMWLVPGPSDIFPEGKIPNLPSGDSDTRIWKV